MTGRSISRQLTQLRTAFRRPLDHRLPGHVVGAIEKGLRRRRAEVERLDARGGLPLALGLDDGDLLAVEPLEPQRRVGEHLALRVVERLPGIEVDQHVHLDAVERRLHAKLGHLVPAEIENAGDRPAIAVGDAALERGIDLARRGGDGGAAERLDHIAVDRGDPDLESGEVDLVDLLVEIDVERNVVELARQIVGIEFLVVQLVDVLPGAVLALLAHRLAVELEPVRLRHQVGIERAGHVGDVDHARAHRIAHLERGHRARAADIVDLDHALAVGVHLLDETFEILREFGALGKGRHGPEGDLLGRGGRCRQNHDHAGDERRAHISLLWNEQRACSRYFLIYSFEYNQGGAELSQLRLGVPAQSGTGMAERSFKSEVAKLRLGAGEEFHGEGILAVTKALLQSGVSYVSGYQGAPISHLVDVLADADDVLRDLGIRFEASANEAAAAATLAASINYPLRGAATFKSTVGTNVASDALANLASGGVTGGALIIVGEDYGEGSSIMQERSHALAMKSQMWLLDPRPNLPSIVRAVEDGFALSEATNTPVMLELRIRACHVHGSFIAKNNVRPSFTLKDAMENPVRDVSRIVLPPGSFQHEQEKIQKRWPAAQRFVQEHRLNEFVAEDAQDFGIILQGGIYNTTIRSLELLGFSDAFGNSADPLSILNVTYPLVDSEIRRFCAGKRAVLMIEEGQPDFLEQNLNVVLRKAGISTAVHGKDMLPMAGEYTPAAVIRGILAFVDAYGSHL